MDLKAPIGLILDAAVEASRDLGDWQKGKWSNDDRNEQWVHSYLAIRLNDYARKKATDRTSVLVTLESKVSWLNFDCEASPKRGRRALKRGQRFDLAVWEEDQVVGLVEVKNAPRTHDKVFTQDLNKLRAALKRWGPAYGGTLQWGVFLFSAVQRGRGQECARDGVEEELKRRLTQCRVGTDPTVRGEGRPVSDDEDCMLGWGAVEITPSC